MLQKATKLLQGSPSSQIVKKKLTDDEIRDLQQELTTKDHMIPLAQLCVKLNTDATNGLTEKQAAEILLKVGPNALTPPKVTPEYIKFIKCMFHGFAGLLWACSILCYILYGISMATQGSGDGVEWLGLIITAICIFSGVFAYKQESKSTKVNESLIISTSVFDSKKNLLICVLLSYMNIIFM